MEIYLAIWLTGTLWRFYLVICVQGLYGVYFSNLAYRDFMEIYFRDLFNYRDFMEIYFRDLLQGLTPLREDMTQLPRLLPSLLVWCPWRAS